MAARPESRHGAGTTQALTTIRESSASEATPQIPSPPYPSQPGTYSCGVCKRIYERADHLARHMKSHENARRFQCPQCSRGFNRVDLLRRHMAVHERHAVSGSNGARVRRNERAGQACVACAAAKARCENRKPCQRCRRKQIPCQTPNQLPHATFEPASHDSLSHNLSPYASPTQASKPSERPVGGQGANMRRPSREQIEISTRTDAPSATAPEPTLSSGENGQQPSPERLMSVAPDELGSIALEPGQFEAIMSNMYTTHFNNQNLDFEYDDFEFYNFEFQPHNISIGNAVNSHVIIDETTTKDHAMEGHRARRDVSRGYAAFARSPWLWTPAQEDHILSGQNNLALDEDSMTTDLSPSSRAQTNDFTSYGSLCIDAGLRDKMFYLVATMNSKYTKIIPKFPSLELLNHIIGAYFVQQSYQFDVWIHLPTIVLGDVHPEFLLALIVAGSSMIAVPAIWKLGLVLQDVVRFTVGELVSFEQKQYISINGCA